MRHGRLVALFTLALLAAAPAARADDTRYALVNGCFSLTSHGTPVAADSGPFRMQATALGSYLLYGTKQDFLARTQPLGRVGRATAPSDQADWTVDGTTGAYTLTLKATGQQLASAAGGLTLVPAGSAGDAGLFGFAEASGCAVFPESDVGVEGAPSTSPSPWGEITGMLDAHMHWMAYEFLGGRAHCGKPWDRFGITLALTDCPDHSVPGSPGNVLEAALGGKPTHDTVGWPTFGYWPNYFSETHESTYYKWVERAWRGGLRLFVNLYVDNAALCKVFPLKKNPCNEMATVRLEMQRLRELQDYVDAQNGGPGKGWFRLVTTPFEARQVIASGKLAIIQGIEVSQLFDCSEYNGVPMCDKAKVDRNLDAVYSMGVRGMELVNKFDNAFVGVAGDNGTQGIIVNSGQKEETGHYWDMQTCQGLPADVHDKNQLTPSQSAPFANATLFGSPLFPGGQVPVYPPPPHCNTRGLSTLGEYLIDRMMAKGMIIDPDHMSVLARNAALDRIEAARYSGVVSSHSWSTPDAYPRIYKLGGVVTPIGSSSKSMVEDWKTLKPMRDKRFYFGFGWGADLNGFHSSGGPRGANAANPVTYPFKSWDGKQTISKLTTGKRTWDINADGVAHYGLYPDWVEDVRKLAGDEIVNDLGRGAEAYLEMWERASGVPAYRPVPARSVFTGSGLFKVRLGATAEALLRSAGQPIKRGPFVWRWSVQKRLNRGGNVYAVLDNAGVSKLVLSTSEEHRAGGINVADRATRVRGAKRVASGVFVRRTARAAYVYGVRKGRVRYVGVTTRATSSQQLRAYLRQTPLG